MERDAAIVVDRQWFQIVVKCPGAGQEDIHIVVDSKAVHFIAVHVTPVLAEKKVEGFDVIFKPVRVGFPFHKLHGG